MVLIRIRPKGIENLTQDRLILKGLLVFSGDLKCLTLILALIKIQEKIDSIRLMVPMVMKTEIRTG